MGAAMFTSRHCRSNANRCIELANQVFEPEMRETLFALAMEWLSMALEFEREAREHEQMLSALQQHLGAQQIAVAKH